jgi:hypothetical protein
MDFPRFLTYLFSLILILLGIINGLDHYEIITGGKILAEISIIVFAIINILFFLLAAFFSERSDDKNYLNLVFLNFIVKFVVVLIIPFIYYQQVKPESSNFIVPYIIVYVVFTIFETWFLSKKVKMRKHK